MKKIILIVIVLVVAGYIVNFSIKNKVKREAEHTEEKRKEQAVKNAISEMASQARVIDDWELRLSKGEKDRSLHKILTIELEKLWLQQPILFIGAIKDIATYDESRYIILVDRDLFGGSLEYFFYPDFQLSLVSSKDKIDSFLKENPQIINDDSWENNGVAVVARVNSVQTTYHSSGYGECEEIKIGNGQLVDIMYVEDIQF